MRLQSSIRILAPTVLLVCGMFIILAGCSEEESLYQIEVRNKLPVLANVSLDGTRDKSVNAGDYEYFYDVEEGTHILRAEASGFDPIEEFIGVDRDIIWTIEEEQ